MSVQKTNKEARYGVERGDIFHSHSVFNYQGRVSFPDIIVYKQNGTIKRIKTNSPYDMFYIPSHSMPEETMICSATHAHRKSRGQDLSTFLKPDANQAVYIATTDDGKAKFFVDAPKYF